MGRQCHRPLIPLAQPASYTSFWKDLIPFGCRSTGEEVAVAPQLRCEPQVPHGLVRIAEKAILPLNRLSVFLATVNFCK